MIFFVAGPGVFAMHECLMMLPNFCIIILCYTERQGILFDCLKKLIQWIASFRTQKNSFRRSIFFQLEPDDSSKAIVEFLKESAVKMS